MRKLATAALSFSAATLLAQYVLPVRWLPFAGTGCVLLALTGFLLRDSVRLRIFLITLGLAAGFFWNFGYDLLFIAPAEKLDRQETTVTAVVCDFPEETDYGCKIPLSVDTGGVFGTKTLLFIFDDATPRLEPGDIVTLTARFSTATEISDDETDIFTSHGTRLLAYKSGEIVQIGSKSRFLYAPQHIRAAVKEKLSVLYAPDDTAFMQALLLGDKSLLAGTPFLKNMAVTGASHVLAVSGMHVVFLIGLLNLLIRRRRTASLIAFPVLLLFMAVVGFSPSVTRAVILQIFVLSAPLVRREADSVTALSAALLLILLLNPCAITGIGLQLSFAATVGILFISQKLYMALCRLLPEKRRGVRRFLYAAARLIFAGISSTAGALVLTVPLVAVNFGYVSVIAPLTNLLVFWAVAAAFCGGIVSCILGFICLPVGSAAAWIVSIPIDYVTGSVDLLAEVPFAALYTSNLYVICWLVYLYLLALLFVLLRGKWRDTIIPSCLAAVSLCTVLLVTAVSADTRSFHVTALDVGQGQSVILTSGAFTAVADCGGSGLENAGDVAAEYVESLGRTRIDLLILTHFHEDHAGGVPELLERIRVDAIAMPDPAISDGSLDDEIIALAREKNIDIMIVDADMSVSFDSSRIQLYAPIGGADENERGLSILFSSGDSDALITGDMSATIERRLISSVSLPDIEVLVVGHHGSKYATSVELLDIVTPEVAVISVGDNSYGHPSPETLGRLSQYGIEVYRTDLTGNVSVSVG